MSDDEPRVILYHHQDWEDLSRYLEGRMREEIKTTVSSEHIKYKYTCSRCGEPCGNDEPRKFFDIKEATINVSPTRQVKLRLAPDLEPSIFLGIQVSVDIEAEEGKAYPEGGNKEKTVIDTCYSCFMEHAVPALVAAGFKVRTEEMDW